MIAVGHVVIPFWAFLLLLAIAWIAAGVIVASFFGKGGRDAFVTGYRYGVRHGWDDAIASMNERRPTATSGTYGPSSHPGPSSRPNPRTWQGKPLPDPDGGRRGD